MDSTDLKLARRFAKALLANLRSMKNDNKQPFLYAAFTYLVFASKASSLNTLLSSMRLTHSGNYKKLRLANNIHLHPRFESFLPTVLFAPEERVRYSCFCAFGRSSETLDSYLANLQKRRKDYGPYLKKSLPEEQARAVLRSLDIQFVNPDPEIYGSEYELLNR